MNNLKSKFPLPAPDLWTACLDSSEIAYLIAFSLGVPDSKVKESPLDKSCIEDIEFNKLEIDSSVNRDYYGVGISQIDENLDMKVLFFDVIVSSTAKGFYRNAIHSDPAEYPDITIKNMYFENITVFTEDQEKSLENRNEFGIYPDFTYNDFLNFLEAYVLKTIDYHDNRIFHKEFPVFPSSIIRKIEKFVESSEFLRFIIDSLEKITVEDLEKVIKVFNLDMKSHRGRIIGKKFGL